MHIICVYNTPPQHTQLILLPPPNTNPSLDRHNSTCVCLPLLPRSFTDVVRAIFDSGRMPCEVQHACVLYMHIYINIFIHV